MGIFRPHLSNSDALPAGYQIRIDLFWVLRTNQTSNGEAFFARLSGAFQFHAKITHIYMYIGLLPSYLLCSEGFLSGYSSFQFFSKAN